MQGRGILSGLTLGTETAEGDDPSPDFGSLWALAVREAVRRNQINDLNAPEERTSNQPQLFNNSDPGVQWPGRASGADFGSVQPPGVGLWPQFSSPNAWLATQGAPNFGSANLRSQTPVGTDDSALALFQPGSGPTGPALNRSSSPTGFLSVGYDDTAATRPWWAPPSILDEWE